LLTVFAFYFITVKNKTVIFTVKKTAAVVARTLPSKIR